MEFQVPIPLILICLLLSGVYSVTFTIKKQLSIHNMARNPNWGWCRGGAQLSSSGFELASGALSGLNIPAPWSGHFWAWTQCSDDSGKFTCGTGDCGSSQVTCNGAGAIPPASLTEFTLAANGGEDFYDISLVDGFNLPVSVVPVGGSDTCWQSSCPSNVNSVCPKELAVKGTNDTVIACKSACLAFNSRNIAAPAIMARRRHAVLRIIREFLRINVLGLIVMHMMISLAFLLVPVERIMLSHFVRD